MSPTDTIIDEADIDINTKALVRLRTIDDIKNFVEVAATFPSSIYVITKDGGKVDGKSILGLFSIGLLDEITVEIDSENYEECIIFQEEMAKFQEVKFQKAKGGVKSNDNHKSKL